MQRKPRSWSATRLVFVFERVGLRSHAGLTSRVCGYSGGAAALKRREVPKPRSSGLASSDRPTGEPTTSRRPKGNTGATAISHSELARLCLPSVPWCLAAFRRGADRTARIMGKHTQRLGVRNIGVK